MDEREIDINIWDDFYDDGYVPEGEVAESYIYVEDEKIPNNKKKEYLEKLLKYINDKLNTNGIKIWLGTSQYTDDPEPQIRLENITHKRLGEWLVDLKLAGLEGDGLPFNIYSES